MVDMHLFTSLMMKIKTGSRIVFVGDKDQLESVGPGNVFKELIDSRVIPVTVLDQCFRQENPTILENAIKINCGKQNLVYDNSFSFVAAHDDEEAAKKIMKLFDMELSLIHILDINWERYDLIDSNGNIQSMAENFNNMKQLSEMLLIVVSAASFIILSLIFLFWMKNRTQEIGIFMALGESKKKIWSQFLWEAMLIGVLGLVLSFMISPALSKMTASYMAQQSQSQAEEQKEATENQVFADGYTAPDLKLQNIEIEVTSDMLIKDTIAIGGLLFISVSVSYTHLIAVNSRCVCIYHQPKMPKEMKQLKND